MEYRIGIGKDSHRFLAESEIGGVEQCRAKPLVLGGVVVPNGRPFKAHSDGDVVFHAVFNAIASALGEESIGKFFPDTDVREAGRDSAEYLSFIVARGAERGFDVQNVSIVIECREPKIDPLAGPIKVRLAELLRVEPERIGITATTGEGMTPWGQGQGVEVSCSVLLCAE